MENEQTVTRISELLFLSVNLKKRLLIQRHTPYSHIERKERERERERSHIYIYIHIHTHTHTHPHTHTPWFVSPQQ